MKRNDWLLAIFILLVAGVGYFSYIYLGAKDAGAVVVTVDGEVYGTYSLKKNQEIAIGDTNYLMIQDGKADMTKANCPDLICVRHKAISRNGETIACLPNKVIVEVVGGENPDADAVAR